MLNNKVYGFRLWLRRVPERLTMRFVWHLPRYAVMWAGYRLLAHATSGKWGNEHPPSVKMWDVLERWEDHGI